MKTVSVDTARKLKDTGLVWGGRVYGDLLLHYPNLADIRGKKQYKPVAKVPILGNVPPARVSDAYGRLLCSWSMGYEAM